MVSSLQNGINAAKAGRMQEALDFLKDAIIEEPQNADVWVWIAAIIDDGDKQEIFLKKALEIDPHNIPAQRGLAYLQKRQQDQAAVKGDHLSDHTSPISPFPASGRPQSPRHESGWTKLELNDLDDLASSEGEEPAEPDATEATGSVFKDLPRLSWLEIVLLGVVVVVFCFIGILAASAIFDVDLPFDFLKGSPSGLAAEPPYPGVFLYENEIYFDIQKHKGLPSQDVGIPTSFTTEPTFILWETEAEPERLHLIYETGEYISFEFTEGRGDLNMLQPSAELRDGLYCFQQTPDVADAPEATAVQAASYWCFHVDLAAGEN